MITFVKLIAASPVSVAKGETSRTPSADKRINANLNSKFISKIDKGIVGCVDGMKFMSYNVT